MNQAPSHHSKPITNEEFQAMIPPHFLGKPTETTVTSVTQHEPTQVVTLTIQNPDQGMMNGIVFPDSPKTIGKLTETITKSTFTETVVTRVTDNKYIAPVIIEVSRHWEWSTLHFN